MFVQADYEDASAVALFPKHGLPGAVLHFDINDRESVALARGSFDLSDVIASGQLIVQGVAGARRWPAKLPARGAVVWRSPTGTVQSDGD